MLKHIVICVSIGIALAANHPNCGKRVGSRDSSVGYVVGGTNSNAGEWPWQCSLEYNSDQVGWYHTCGCSVINENWILTAAHCVDRSSSGSMYRVVTGELDRTVIEGKESWFDVTKVIQHPQWDSAKINNDVAVMKLSRSIAFNGNESHVVPVCLPDKTSNLDDVMGKECWATGWGHTKWQGQVAPVLQKVKIDVVAQQSCKSKYSFVIAITNGMICFGENGKGTCQGDSGGPLNCLIDGKWTSYGATSFGVQCAGPTYPSVSARVSEFSDWIWSTTASN